jgi:hypothetical protein
MKFNILFIICLFSLIQTSFALSESFQGTGQINAWHDGYISDRVSGQGVIEYAAERYDGGFSSGFNISNGFGSYSFRAADYSIRLDEFSGSIVAESDKTSTTVDGTGTGIMKTRSFNASRMGVLVSGFPSGEINAKGVWTIKASSTRSQIPDPMAINVTEDGAPSGNLTIVVINSTSEVPI